MKIPAIKKLIETQNLEALKSAEEALMNELQVPIEIEGEDEGEQLTHVLAAIWIKEEMLKNQTEFAQALRLYTARVRKSIS